FALQLRRTRAPEIDAEEAVAVVVAVHRPAPRFDQLTDRAGQRRAEIEEHRSTDIRHEGLPYAARRGRCRNPDTRERARTMPRFTHPSGSAGGGRRRRWQR